MKCEIKFIFIDLSFLLIQKCFLLVVFSWESDTEEEIRGTKKYFGNSTSNEVGKTQQYMREPSNHKVHMEVSSSPRENSGVKSCFG